MRMLDDGAGRRIKALTFCECCKTPERIGFSTRRRGIDWRSGEMKQSDLFARYDPVVGEGWDEIE